MDTALSRYEGRPLRVMQVIPFYESYLNELYQKQLRLVLQSFAAQTKVLEQGAFAAIHVFTPYLKDCETLLAVSNNPFSQYAWLKEHGLEVEDKQNWQQDILRKQVAHFKPDILYSDAETWFTEFVHTLPHPRPKIVAWRAADVSITDDWSCYDAILSGLPKLLAFTKSKGARDTFLFHPGMPQWLAEKMTHIPQDVDVVFAGSISPFQHVKRYIFLDLLAEEATKHGFSLRLYLNCDPSLISEAMRPYVRPAVFGLHMHRALRRGRIVLDDRAWHGVVLPNGQKTIDLAGDDTSNMRIFEGTGGGSLLLTEHLQGVSRYFEIDKEVVTYKNYAEAVDKILYYRIHEEEREKIAKAGQERCLKDWSMTVVTHKFLEMAQKVLAQ